MKIIYEDNHLLVVERPVNIPVQADSSNDEDLLSLRKDYIKKAYDKPGNVYLGLVHRLDRPVGGVMVFARTSKAASRLSKAVSTRQFGKTYLAVVEGTPESDSGSFEDYLVKDNDTNTVTVTDAAHGKHALLDYQLLGHKDGLSLLRIRLHTGRSHQIRVQTSSRGLPIWGDQRYNRNAKKHQQIALWSYRLEFDHPVTGVHLIFTCDPPDAYPYSLFEGVNYEKDTF